MDPLHEAHKDAILYSDRSAEEIAEFIKLQNEVMVAQIAFHMRADKIVKAEYKTMKERQLQEFLEEE